jgi:hypothetical protein
MDRATIEPAIKVLLTEIHTKLSEAVRIATGRQWRRRRRLLDGYRAIDL